MKLALVVFLIGTIVSATEEGIDTVSKDGIKQFSANLFIKEIKDNPPINEVHSGYAALPVLALLCFASSGETHLELHDTLGIANEQFRVKQEYVNMNKLHNVTLTIANRVYITNNVTLKKEFVESLKSRFDSEIQSIEFLNETTSSTEINNWFENQTNHNITNILLPQDLHPNTSIVALSAIYFHGNWEISFDKNKSAEMDFNISKNNSVKVVAMHGMGVYKYLESKSLNAKILELPYAENNTALYIVLPNVIDDLHALEEKLMNRTFISVETREMASRSVNISLPKFKIETKTCLKRALMNLNIKQMFNATLANLHNMLEKENEQVYVNEIIQKSVFEICECGVNNATTYNDDYHIEAEFRADHPFLFFVKKDDNYILGGVYYGLD